MDFNGTNDLLGKKFEFQMYWMDDITFNMHVKDSNDMFGGGI